MSVPYYTFLIPRKTASASVPLILAISAVIFQIISFFLFCLQLKDEPLPGSIVLH
jgi:hypothetical protein